MRALNFKLVVAHQWAPCAPQSCFYSQCNWLANLRWFQGDLLVRREPEIPSTLPEQKRAIFWSVIVGEGVDFGKKKKKKKN
jgi:hypothetical protein